MYGVMSAAFCAPLFAQPLALGLRDWDQHFFYYSAALKSVIEYGQAPFWNPWYCGGNVLWQNPQVPLVSIVYPLALMMPIQLAMKVNVVLHYWIGFVGMHVLLTRVVGLRFLPVVVCLAALFTMAGAPVMHVAVGHSNFLSTFYLPLHLYFVLRAFESGSGRDLTGAAALLALMVFAGGPHVLPMAFAAVGVLALAVAVARRHWRPLAVSALIVVAGPAYAAPKLLPVVLYATGDRFWDTRNPTGHPDRVTFEMARDVYLNAAHRPYGPSGEQRHEWHEYGNYIGPFSAFAIVVGVAWALWGRGVPDARMGRALAVTAVFLFLLSLGEFSSLAPASIAAHVPLFSSFRIPSRYTISFLLVSTVALAWCCRAMALERGRLGAQIAAGVVCLSAAGHLAWTNHRLLEGVFSVPPFDTSFQWMAGPDRITVDAASSPYTNDAPMLRALMNDRQFFYCYESLQLVRTAVPDQAVVFTDGKSTLTGVRFTPNRIDFTVVGGPEPSRVYLNYNWGPGWQSDAGPIDATSREVMAFVTLAPGQSGHYSFWYVPPGLWAGVTIFLAGIAASWWLRGARGGPTIEAGPAGVSL
jgi:hypothetical protein